MAVSAQFKVFVLDLLGEICNLTARGMFGAVVLYAGGVCFAIADDDVLYFRIDAADRCHYEAAGMQAFAPMGPAPNR